MASKMLALAGTVFVTAILLVLGAGNTEPSSTDNRFALLMNQEAQAEKAADKKDDKQDCKKDKTRIVKSDHVGSDRVIFVVF